MLPRRASRTSESCFITQWIFRLRSPGLSSMCCDENLPFFSKSNFMHSNTSAIAIINTLKMKVSAIFLTFAVAKIVQNFEWAKLKQ